MSIFSFTHNPIARAETALQQQIVPMNTLRRIMRYTFRILLTVTAVGLIGLEFVAAITRSDITALSETLGVVVQIYLLLVVIQHFSIMFRTLGVTVAAIERDRKHNERWESIVMTGIGSHEIVLGKWWAVVRARWKDYAWLALWRAGAAIYLGAGISRVLANVMTTSISTSTTSVDISVTVPTPLHFLMAALTVVVLTMINLLFTAACGVYAGIAFKRGAMAAAIITRGGLIAGFSIGMFVIFCQLTTFSTQYLVDPINGDYSLGTTLVGVMTGSLGTLYDNGITLAASTVSYGYNAPGLPFSDTIAVIWVLTLVVAVGYYAVLTILALFMAQAQAERFGALKTFETKGKAK